MINNYNLIGRQFSFELHDNEELTSDLIRKYGCNVDMEGVYAYNYLLKEGDIFLDIGANIGWNTVFGSMAVGTTGQVYSFEPDSKNFQLLENNKERNNLSNVTLVKQALGESEYIGQLFQSNNNFGNHMLSPEYYSPDTHPERVSVPVTTLDRFLDSNSISQEKIALIKIDVEGSEPRVLEGAKKFFSRYRPVIAIEFSPFCIKQCGSSMFDILSFIDRNNYVPHLIDFIDIYKPEYKLTPLSVLDLIHLGKDLFDRAAYKDLLLLPPNRL